MSGIGKIVSQASLALVLSAAFALPAFAQPAPDDLQGRIQRLERAVRALQTESGAPQGPPAPGDDVNGGAPDQPTVDLGPILRRVDELDQSLGRLTGQMEELGHQLDLLSQKADRMQKEIDLQASGQTASMPPLGPPPASPMPSLGPDSGAPGLTPAPPPPADGLASAAPPDANGPTLKPYQPGVLGTLPQGAASPKPKGDPKHDFDAAMMLLTRAQYDPASQAFRAFADAYPDDDRAPMALFWTGDIAYSAKKDYNAAALDFAELLKKYPDSMRAPEGMLKLGLSLFQLGMTKEGCTALAALPAKYPGAAAALATQARNARRENKCK